MESHGTTIAVCTTGLVKRNDDSNSDLVAASASDIVRKMAPFSKQTFAFVLSSSLLLHLFLIQDRATVSGAVSASPRRSLDFSSVQACRCCQSSSKYQYSVVIDAGSSGSRVHVYSWPQNTAGRVESTPGAVKSLRPTLKIRVGLATVARDLTVVRQHIERLLINASRIVPPELHRYTPVYFMATAGKQSVTYLLYG